MHAVFSPSNISGEGSAGIKDATACVCSCTRYTVKSRMHVSPAEDRTSWPVLETLWKSRCGLQEFTVTCLVLMVRVKGWEM